MLRLPTAARPALRLRARSSAPTPTRPPAPPSHPPATRHFSSAAPLSTQPRPRRWPRVALALGALGGVAYAWDVRYNGRAAVRTLRTLYTCAIIGIDYKLNFQPGSESAERIPALHERVAERVYDLLTTNGGLYIKIGQAIGANPGVLPRPFQTRFAALFDDAPQIPLAEVLGVFKKEFGKPPDGPDGVFAYFDPHAVASASLAQVHRALTKPTLNDQGQVVREGEWVAVKVQKPEVGKQVEWDLAAYALVMYIYEHYLFDLPATFIVPFVSERLRSELDFEGEARNAERTRELVMGEARLKDKVYVPKVYHEYTTKKVMTAEWIDGVRLSDRAGVRRLMGEKAIQPGRERVMDIVSLTPSEEAVIAADHAARTPSPFPSRTTSNYNTTSSPNKNDGETLAIPMGLEKPLRGGTKAVMETMVELFSTQIFEWGWVHCDPHPGNVVIRPVPLPAASPASASASASTTSKTASSSSPSQSSTPPPLYTYTPAPPSTYTREPQLVLLDHGLYVSLSPAFRRDMARLWKALFTLDQRTISEVGESWGFGAPDFFASAILLKPVKLEDENKGAGKTKAEEERKTEGKEEKELDQYEMSMRMKEKLKSFLKETDKMPKALFFLMRNMRMVQGNNQSLGSPVNRIKITSLAASRALASFPDASFAIGPTTVTSNSTSASTPTTPPPTTTSLPRPTPSLTTRLHAQLQHVLFLWTIYSLDALFALSKLRQWIRGKAGVAGEGFEDELEAGMRQFAKGNFGVEIEDGVFDG